MNTNTIQSISTGKELQWDFIYGLFENAIYGGRVDNPFDMRVLRSYLSQYFNKDVLAGGGAKRPKKIPAGVSVPSSAYYRVNDSYCFISEKIKITTGPNFMALLTVSKEFGLTEEENYALLSNVFYRLAGNFCYSTLLGTLKRRIQRLVEP